MKRNKRKGKNKEKIRLFSVHDFPKANYRFNPISRLESRVLKIAKLIARRNNGKCNCRVAGLFCFCVFPQPLTNYLKKGRIL